jgi:hypothetical protein
MGQREIHLERERDDMPYFLPKDPEIRGMVPHGGEYKSQGFPGDSKSGIEVIQRRVHSSTWRRHGHATVGTVATRKNTTGIQNR